jgi:hypothetical protein
MEAGRIPVADWTCDRCGVTVRWMEGYERIERPPDWSEEGERSYCLACRRERAAEAGLEDAAAEPSAQRRAQIRAAAIVDFEVQRNPGRRDGEIARAARSSVAAVSKARERLGLAAPPPP